METVRSRPSWYEITLLVPWDWQEALPGFLEDLGCTGLWIEQETTSPLRAVVRVYLPSGQWQPQLMDQIRGHLEDLSRLLPVAGQQHEVAVRSMEEEDWASQWLPFFEPLRVGSVWIRPRAKSVSLGPGEKEILLDPGQAFGTGHHETTQLCLEVMEALRPRLRHDAFILDVGTGSGILAMFAARVGFRHIWALDNDPAAVETAEKNIADNGLASRIVVSGRPLQVVDERFDLILANLTAKVLKDLCGDLKRHMKRGGFLVVSGLLVEEKQGVREAFASQGMERVDEQQRGEWACLTFRLS